MPLTMERFNDAGYPFNHAEECHTVLCVASNMILWFDGRRYFEAIESHGREKPRLQLTVSDVYTPSMIKARFIAQPLIIDERNDPAKPTKNYSDVIKKAAGILDVSRFGLACASFLRTNRRDGRISVTIS